MPRSHGLVTLVVPDYDQAITYFCGTLGFDLIEDTDLGNEKRWVLVAPKVTGTAILLARAASDAQRRAIGHQTGGRVAFFLVTEDFERDFAAYSAAGVNFTEDPRTEPYGIVAVFRDCFGNLWDLIQPTSGGLTRCS